MSRLQEKFAVAAAVVSALLMLIFLTLVFIPDRELQGVVSRILEKKGYTFSAGEFGKSFPLGIAAKKIEVGDDRGPILKADDLYIRLRILPLFIGQIRIALDARIGSGEINGEYASTGGGSADLKIKRLQLEEVPFFKTVAGAAVKGDLTVGGNIKNLKKNAQGEIKLAVRGADMQGVKIGEMPLPDAAYHTVQGMLKFGSGKAALESFTLQGDGLFVRLKGDLPVGAAPAATPLNLTLELMPKPEFMEKQKFVFLLLIKYLTSPGSYQIPIRGTLARPSI
ncbi:MAG: type II secretion system protein GspN [Geobacteraceae bacterium GWC2_48_7]|nr:MAG: type II secretion system protein GspN [Geobacteraceae bacterium GWC2_48_7]